MNCVELQEIVKIVLKRACHCSTDKDGCPKGWHTWRRIGQERNAVCFVGRDGTRYDGAITVNMISIESAENWITRGEELDLNCTTDPWDGNERRVCIRTRGVELNENGVGAF